ncbi:MAG: hypothetical protein COZ92_02150, partial [Candidatus Nealsonbacteria bacterium CG_4_8_14_3_um_filter_40_11]
KRGSSNSSNSRKAKLSSPFQLIVTCPEQVEGWVERWDPSTKFCKIIQSDDLSHETPIRGRSSREFTKFILSGNKSQNGKAKLVRGKN